MRISQRFLWAWLIVATIGATIGAPLTFAAGADDAHHDKAQQSITRGVAYLRQTQNEDGSWSPQPGPAVTALVMTALLDQPDVGADDLAVTRALAYILSKQKDNGGIYEDILPNYNTAICLSALTRLRHRPDIEAALEKAEQFLRGLQYGVGDLNEHPKVHTGGVGYGKHGRPDGSNLSMFTQALHDLGCQPGDPAMAGAVEFWTRLQGSATNTVNGDKIVQDGGAIYAPSINKDLVGVPQSMASPEMIDEGKAGQPVSGLRTYGSMTYAMFKTYVYAQLPRDDQRVIDAVNWIRRNYSVDHNPGMPDDLKHHGYYYYLLTMSRALRAYNDDLTDSNGAVIPWRNDLIDKVAELQRADGSWINPADRWMEGDANLVTAYALIALTQADR